MSTTGGNLALGASLGANGPLANIGGLVSGLDTNTLVNELMSIESQGQQSLQTEQATQQSKVSTYQAINSAVSAFQQAAQALDAPSGWLAASATSSSAGVVASAQSSAPTGSLTFTVNSLAAAAADVSSGSVGSLSTVVATHDILLSQASTLGFSTLSGGPGLAAGPHTLVVTQSSSGAALTGASPLAPTTTISPGANDTIAYTLDGVGHTAVLAGGSYTPAQLTAAIGAASGGALAAAVDPSGRLVLSTVAEGSAHSLSITGGDGLAGLGLTIGSATGTDGAVTLDGGAAVAVSDARAGATFSLPGSGGSVSAVLAGGLRAGTTTLTDVAAGDGQLATVVANINAAHAGLTATAVQVGAGAYRLQLASAATGAASALTVDPGAFSGLGSMTTLTAGTDASLSVGTGPGAYAVTSATNSVNGLMPGVNLTLAKADPSTPVTVTVAQDPATLATAVQKMVDAANTALSTIASATAYDSASGTGGPLLGDVTVQDLQNQILSAVSDLVGGSASASPATVGLQLTSTGSITFDQTKFTAAYRADPAATSAMFQQPGTSAGIAQRLEAVGKGATDFTTGTLTLAVSGGQAEVKDLAAQIAAWQPILDGKRQSLLDQFMQMETALSQLKSQSSSLAAALGTASSTPVA